MAEPEFADISDPFADISDPFKSEGGEFEGINDPYADISDPFDTPEPEAPAVEPGITAGDFGRSVMAGGAQVGSGMGWLAEQAGRFTGIEGLEEAGTTLRERGDESARMWREEMGGGYSPGAREVEKQTFLESDPDSWTGYKLGDAGWDKTIMMLGESLLGTAAGMGAGAAITAPLKLLPGVSKGVAAGLGYSAGEALVAAPSAGAAAEQEIREMEFEDLEDHVEYQALLLTDTPPEEAKEKLARAAGGDAAMMTAISTAVLSGPFGKALDKIAGGEGSSLVGGAIKGGATEAGQEAVQSGAEQISTNLATLYQGDVDKGVFEGVPEAVVGGAAAGGVMGAGFGAHGGYVEGKRLEALAETKRKADEAAAAAAARGGDALDQEIARTDVYSNAPPVPMPTEQEPLPEAGEDIVYNPFQEKMQPLNIGGRTAADGFAEDDMLPFAPEPGGGLSLMDNEQIGQQADLETVDFGDRRDQLASGIEARVEQHAYDQAGPFREPLEPVSEEELGEPSISAREESEQQERERLESQYQEAKKQYVDRQTTGPKADPGKQELKQWAVSQLGAIDIDEARAQGIDPDMLNAKVGGKRLFKEGGQSFETAAERAAEDGFLEGEVTGSAFLDKISRSMAGEEQFTPAGLEDEATRQYAQQRMDESQEAIDEFNLNYDEEIENPPPALSDIDDGQKALYYAMEEAEALGIPPTVIDEIFDGATDYEEAAASIQREIQTEKGFREWLGSEKGDEIAAEEGRAPEEGAEAGAEVPVETTEDVDLFGEAPAEPIPLEETEDLPLELVDNTEEFLERQTDIDEVAAAEQELTEPTKGSTELPSEAERLATKRTLYELFSESGAPEDVVAASVLGAQEKTNTLGAPMEVWVSPTGTVGQMSKGSKPPFKNGRLVTTIYPDTISTPGQTGAGQQQDIDAQAHEAQTSPENDLPQPTEAQIEAGNYKKGHITYQGLDITIENPRGSTRSGKDPDGNEWSHEMQSHYGYIKRTEGADGDQVDVFIGPDIDAVDAYVIDQYDQYGKFDEHKVMLGYATPQEAAEAYLENYDEGWDLGPVVPLPMDGEFQEWLADEDQNEPASNYYAAFRSIEEMPQDGKTSKQRLDEHTAKWADDETFLDTAVHTISRQYRDNVKRIKAAIAKGVTWKELIAAARLDEGGGGRSGPAGYPAVVSYRPGKVEIRDLRDLKNKKNIVLSGKKLGERIRKVFGPGTDVAPAPGKEVKAQDDFQLEMVEQVQDEGLMDITLTPEMAKSAERAVKNLEGKSKNELAKALLEVGGDPTGLTADAMTQRIAVVVVALDMMRKHDTLSAWDDSIDTLGEKKVIQLAANVLDPGGARTRSDMQFTNNTRLLQARFGSQVGMQGETEAETAEREEIRQKAKIDSREEAKELAELKKPIEDFMLSTGRQVPAWWNIATPQERGAFLDVLGFKNDKRRALWVKRAWNKGEIGGVNKLGLPQSAKTHAENYLITFWNEEFRSDPVGFVASRTVPSSPVPIVDNRANLQAILSAVEDGTLVQDVVTQAEVAAITQERAETEALRLEQIETSEEFQDEEGNQVTVTDTALNKLRQVDKRLNTMDALLRCLKS